MRIIDIASLQALVKKIGLQPFMQAVIAQMEQDFARWPEFEKSPRHAIYYPQGVIELMPISDQHTYSFKYINGHPVNTAEGKLSIVGIGMLANTVDGLPTLIAEMTILTAIRTACTTAMAAKYLARPESRCVGLIGTGAQAEFQLLALHAVLPIERCVYFDLDAAAMQKFAENMAEYGIELVAANDAQAVCEQAEVLVTATAAKAHTAVIKADWLQAGQFIAALGGDCPGKTELETQVLLRSTLFVEYTPQTWVEGEIQNLDQSNPPELTELWQVIAGQAAGRSDADQITLFDSVGFALEDFSTLVALNRLAAEHQIGVMLPMLPEVDPSQPAGAKDLYRGLIS